MTDRVPGAPGQYSAVVTAEELLKMQNGENFTITLTRDDHPITEGTPYSKAAVLPDAVAGELCPGIQDPTPADAFGAICDRFRKDYIMEQGRVGSWTYRKWASGVVECWNDNALFGSGNSGTLSATMELPFAFYSANYAIIWNPTQNAQFLVGSCTFTNISNTSFDFGFAKETTSGIRFSFYIVGKWR